MACRQKASVYGEAKIETYASSAWVRASIPVSAVTVGGIVSGEQRIDDRHVGDERVVDQGHLALAGGDHRRGETSEPVPGRGRHRDQLHRVLVLRVLRDPLAGVEERERELAHRQLGALVEEPHRLRGVDHRAAADGDDARRARTCSIASTPARICSSVGSGWMSEKTWTAASPRCGRSVVGDAARPRCRRR